MKNQWAEIVIESFMTTILERNNRENYYEIKISKQVEIRSGKIEMPLKRKLSRLEEK